MSGAVTVTPERAELHAAINARITPAFASVPLLDTCEQIAQYDAFLTRRIAELEQSVAAFEAREAELVEAAFKGRDRLLKEGFLPSDPTVRALNEAIEASLAARAKATPEQGGAA